MTGVYSPRRSVHHGARTLCLIALVLVATFISPAYAVKPRSVDDLGALSIDELANVEISSVSKRAEPLNMAPAAIYVITNEDIRRAGAQSVPEALRLAPNLQVAQINANSYAITARGFNQPTGTANKLLVLIDGRSVYTTLYSGVFWDAQDVLMEDIERIEVIRGPGGTLWGANAVDGVINIITRKSADTQGGLVSLGVGDQESNIALRFGGTVGDSLNYRVYGKAFERGAVRTSTGLTAKDGWDKLQGGFRMDWTQEADTVTVQGDRYSGDADDVANTELSGSNLLARWTRAMSDDTSFELQTYYDHTRRLVVTMAGDATTTYDVSGQIISRLGESHQLVAGTGYRESQDRFKGGPGTAYLDPAKRTTRLANLFVQDTVQLTAPLKFIFGLKGEHNSYTGWEFMPSGRVVWNFVPDQMLWASVSRAVRTPSRYDRDLINPGLLVSGQTFQSEDLLAFEAGYRGEATSWLLLSVSGYYNDYNHLRTVELGPPPALFPLSVKNGMTGKSYGLEAWARMTVTDYWQLSLGGNAMDKNLKLIPGARDFFGTSFAGNDPDYQVSMRSLFNIADNLELDAGLRYVDALPNPRVPSYIEADIRLGWRPTTILELSLTGSNLLHERHAEFGASPTRLEIPRSIYASARWDF